MTLNERIIDFLDGSLPADDEAELLHTLSVSPEKRNMLRGFMRQGALFTRDAKSLSVPYETEQRLWARMDHVLPIIASKEAATVMVPVASSIAGDASGAGFFAHAFSGAASPMMQAALGAFTLLAGIGIGYFAGHSQIATGLATNEVAQAPSTIFNSPDLASSYESHESHRTHESNGTNVVNRTATHNISPRSSELQNQSAPLVPPTAPSDDATAYPISPVAIVNEPTITTADIGGDGVGIKPMLHYIHPVRTENPSLLSRFEFRVDESLGRQYPNNIATTVSQPVLTNLSLTSFFQVFPHSNLFWAGLSGGSAYIARTNLFVPANSQNVLASDTVSTQTGYLAALAELRLPAFDMTDMTFTAGYGYGFAGSGGQMLFGEIGLHGDLSNEAGYECGLRLLQFTYNLTNQENAAKASSGTASLTLPNGIALVRTSYNAELNMGLFFHF